MIETRLDRKNGATMTVEAPSSAHSAMASAMVGRASSMCAVLTSCRCVLALCGDELQSWMWAFANTSDSNHTCIAITYTCKALRTCLALRLPLLASIHGRPARWPRHLHLLQPPGLCSAMLDADPDVAHQRAESAKRDAVLLEACWCAGIGGAPRCLGFPSAALLNLSTRSCAVSYGFAQ